MTAEDHRLRPPDRLRYGSRHKHCKNAGASGGAGTTWQQKSFRNAILPAARNRHALLPPKAPWPECDTIPAAPSIPAAWTKCLCALHDMSVAGYDGRFYLAPAVQHLLQHLLQFGKRRLAGNVISALDVLFRNQ